MKIGVEAQTLFGTPLTGIGNYTWNILQALQRTQPDIELYLYVSSALKGSSLKDLPRARIRHCGSILGFKGYFWTKFVSWRLVCKDQLDAYIAPRVLYPYWVRHKVSVVPIVCDLNIHLCPELMPRGTRVSYRLWFDADIRHSARVVAISQGTSDRLKTVLGRAADVIAPPSVSDLYHPAGAAELEAVRTKYDLPGPYLVFVGTLEPRKNLSTLISAHEAINRKRAEPITLALVGKRGWKNQALIERLDHGIPHVRELGYVPEPDLPHLYSGAEAFVMPSTYEGYGMPAAEARACGTRVVVTDIPELREAAGEAATFVQPTVEGLTRGIEQSLRLPRPAATRSQSWEESARALACLLRDVARK